MYVFTKREIRELIISAVAITFVIAWPDIFGIRGIVNLLLLFLFVGVGFMVHEIAHKLAAQKLGAWSEFVMWKEGLFLALFLKIFTGTTIIAPGATLWAKPLATVDDEGKVSVAGPLANIALAFFFNLFSPIFPIFKIGAYINSQLAFFNLIPFPPLDGIKIILWNPVVWIVCVILTFIV